MSIFPPKLPPGWKIIEGGHRACCNRADKAEEESQKLRRQLQELKKHLEDLQKLLG